MAAVSSIWRHEPLPRPEGLEATYRREEIFKGKHADTAPDILMEPAEQYSLTHAKSALEDADWISGDHRPEGVIVAVGPSAQPFEQQPMLVDLAPTVLVALGAPATIEHTGRVLHEVVGSDAKVARSEPAVQIPGMPTGGESSSVSDTEADERSTSAVSATSSRSGLDPDRYEDRPHLGHVLTG